MSAAAVTAGPASSRAIRLPRPQRPRLWAFGAYLVLGLLSAGWYALSDPSSTCACIGNADPATYMWALEWWPHALLHGLNPFVTHYLWAPTGANVARAATIPAAALVLSPITALFGPVVAYNVLSIASPILAAFTAYLLCRRIVARELPAFVGGLLFGFGAYQFTQLVGHPNLTLVFLVPVAVHLALRRADREISRRAFVGWLAALLVLQVGLSTEVLATGVVLGGVMLVAAYLLAPSPYRSRIGSLIVEVLGAGLLAVIVTSPFLYYALVSGSFPQGPAQISDALGLDLLNPIFPTRASWFNHDFQALGLTFEGGNIAEADGYLSVPIILAFVLWLVGTRRRFLARMLLVAAVISFVAALGSHLHVAGMQTIALPYNWVRNLPVVDFITPSRIIMYTTLAVAIGVADWLADRSGRTAARWLLVGLGVLLLVPNIPSEYWGTPPDNPSFFTTSTYKHFLVSGETALVLPYGANDNSMLWQAETDFAFKMPEGYLGNSAPPAFANQVIPNQLGGSMPVDPHALLAFLQRYHVRDVIVYGASAQRYVATLLSFGLTAQQAGGVTIVHIPPSAV